MARLVTLNVPSLCAVNGTAIAAGYWLSLSHDFQLMSAQKGTICLSELKLGLTIPFPYTRMLAAKLDPKIVTKISYSVDYKSEEALSDGLVTSLYSNQTELDTQIKQFAKRFAFAGAHRDAM